MYPVCTHRLPNMAMEPSAPVLSRARRVMSMT